MKIELTGKRAVITGGSRGIGRAIALGCADARAAVSVLARGADRVAGGPRRDRGAPRHGACLRRATWPTARRSPRYIEAAADALGGIDILVCNASGSAPAYDEAGWQKSIDCRDPPGTVRAIRAALPYLEKSRGRLDHQHLVDLRARRLDPHATLRRNQGGTDRVYPDGSFAAGEERHPRQLHCTGFDRVSRRHLGAAERRTTRSLYGAILRSIPFGRLGRPEEVAQVAVFLASPLAGWVTGQTISVDGGQLLR